MSQFSNICTGGLPGHAECPTDSHWTGLMVGKLKAHNKGSFCVFLAAAGSWAATAAGREEGSGGWNWAHAERLWMRSTGPLATHVLLCVCVNMCTHSFMCVTTWIKITCTKKGKKSSSVINKSSCRETVKRLNLQKNRPTLGFLEWLHMFCLQCFAWFLLFISFKYKVHHKTP